MPRPALLALFAAPLMLTACGAGETPDASSGAASSVGAEAIQNSFATGIPSGAATTVSEAPSASAQDGDSCGASKVSARWLNSLPSADVKVAIAEAVGDRPIRYYAEGDPITMDYSEDRLNVVLGKDGRIKEFRCG